MKRVLLRSLLGVLIGSLLISACSVLGQKPESDSQVSTQVSGVLTALPTSPASHAATQTAEALEVQQSATPTAEPTLPEDIPTSTLTATATLPPMLTASGTATTTPLPTATVTPTVSPDEPRAKLGAPTGGDTLDNATDWQWGMEANAFTQAGIQDGAMVITGLRKATGWRLPKVDSSPDMYIEALFDSGACRNKDSYGIMFRIPDYEANNQGYMFTIACDGTWRLWEYDGTKALGGNIKVLVDWQDNKIIDRGAHKTNRIGVWTQGEDIYLYANGVLLNKDLKISNSSFADGTFGVFILPNVTVPYTMSVLEVTYWKDARR